MQEMICTKCKGRMLKKGIMDSGNTKYDVFMCEKCSNKTMRAQNTVR